MEITTTRNRNHALRASIFAGAAYALLAFGTVACGKPNDPQLTDGCTYKYSSEGTTLKWTAYKFTEKVGVSGTFDRYEVTGNESGTTAREAVAGLRFKIDSLSVNSGVPDRDAKISREFFGTMQNAGSISGHVKSVTDDGTGVISLEFNNQTRDLPVTYTLTDNVNLTVKSSLNVNDWAAEASLKALNKVCEALHTSADGKSVLWPDVSVEINAVLQRDCAQ